ncbi:MAG TPA: hypothetical protein VGO47_12640 [Chlamydiales bacterium]|jgi:hypothetical protein|nr:hypothetical protein [Chlamydiales bacterium]
MFNHSFIFNPGSWIGEGKITLNMVEEDLTFNSNWTVMNKDFAGKVSCAQDIAIHGLSDCMRNELTFYGFENKGFSVDMENPNIGKITGVGVFDEKTIAWEFRDNGSNFEGYESYDLQADGSYIMRGEYVTSDQLRTKIEAKIWPGSKEVSEKDPTQEEEP